MNKILIATIGCMLSILCAVYAKTDLTEDEYRDLSELRSKLVRMKKETDRFVKELMATYPGQESFFAQDFGGEVKVDVAEKDKEIIVKADLPGMEKDKIDITLTNDKILKISGARDVFKEEVSGGMVKQERLSGKFERVVELPGECMSDGIKAAYKDGVLEITIPKKEKSKEKSVKVAVQ